MGEGKTAEDDRDRIREEMHSWRGVAGLLAERSLADRQDEVRRSGLSPVASSHRHSRAWTVPAPDDLDVGSSTFSLKHPSSTVQSPSASAFDLGFTSPLGTPQRSRSETIDRSGPPSRTPKSVPGTPLRTSHPSTPCSADPDVKNKRNGSHQNSLLSIHSPLQSRRASKQLETADERSGRADGLPARTAGLEITIPKAGSKGNQRRTAVEETGPPEMETLLSSSPPAINSLDRDQQRPGQPQEQAGSPPVQERKASAKVKSQAAAIKPGPTSFRTVPEITDTSSTAILGARSTGLSQRVWSRFNSIHRFQLTLPQKQILKCSIAYFIASLFTFVPFFANLLSTDSETDVHGRVRRKPAYSAHMVATVMCYFHPARSAGGMLLASKYCIILASIAACFCLLSIVTQFAFDRYIPSAGVWVFEAGDMFVLFVWVFMFTGGLAWLKQWVNNPAFNTGCSMAAVTMFTVVVKDGGLRKLAEVLLIVTTGATISNIVCFLLWPSSATSRLQGSISNTLNSFSTLLNLLGATFLLDRPPGDATYASLAKAVKAHNDTFTKLKADLAEAKHEEPLDGRMDSRQQQRYAAVVTSLQKLAQHLTGLRSGTGLQMDLLKASQDGRISLRAHDAKFKPVESDESDDESEIPDVEALSPSNTNLAKAGELFYDFRHQVAHPTRAIVALGAEGLETVKRAMTESTNPAKALGDLQRCRDGLQKALGDFRQCTLSAMRHLQPAKVEEPPSGETMRPPWDTDEPQSLENPTDAVLQIYFFVFTLEEFIREDIKLIEAMTDLLDDQVVSRLPSSLRWLRPSHWRSTSREPTIGRRKTLRGRVAKLIPIDPSDLQPEPLFPDKKRNKHNTLTIPPRHTLSRSAKWKQSLWTLLARLKEPDIKYAFKVGVGTVILAFPAFTATFRETFLDIRGEWALLGFWASMSPSIGATNFLAFYRLAGTLLGAGVAVVVYTAFPDNAIVLPIAGFLFSMPCFWIITQRPVYQQAGRFILLAYNLTCLYAYNQRDRDMTALEIAWRRSTAILAGLIWATIVSNYWWPFAARRELRMGLSDFCLDLAYLYSKLVQVHSKSHSNSCYEHPLLRDIDGLGANEETTPLIPNEALAAGDSDQDSFTQFLSMELHLQIQIIDLRALLAQTKNEPRLKGPFPYEMYASILGSCQTLLDKLHSMRCVVSRQEWDTTLHRDVLKPTSDARKEMSGNVILYFYLLSAAFRLRSAMPPILPPAEISRQRLVNIVRELDFVKRKAGKGDIRQLLIFTYSLAMQGVIQELHLLGTTLQDAFGVISQTGRDDFEALFI